MQPETPAPQSLAMPAMRLPTKLPSLADIGTFDGTDAARRWLARLRWALKSLNNGSLPDPSVAIQAIDVGLAGEAATFVDSTMTWRDVVVRAGNGEATLADLEHLETALKDRFAPITDNAGTRIQAPLQHKGSLPDPSVAIQAIGMRMTIQEARFVDSTMTLKDIVVRARNGEATMADLKDLKTALRPRASIRR
ncbi:hypothetical protein G6O67_001118 [Ophiocordyceps sinensis]|uniref:Uncharacterized protein n=1 Tax=Ophiocordyceps sinensis TaxID=72228 RepID=A0A8H4PX11_9HYPO|nr:hypothetical protein G6O67_001118 [Ophiocordyceps sinensis]